MPSRQIHLTAPTRDAFLTAVYDADWVAHGDAVRGWTGKLWQYQELLRWNPGAAEGLPRTLPLSACPGWERPGVSEAEAVTAWTAREFPSGFVVKPEVGHSSEAGGFIQDVSGLLGAWERLHTGEWLIQERIGGHVGPGSPDEFRVHTFWHRVVPEATFSRWDLFWEDARFEAVEAAVQQFLDVLPPERLRGHAWGLDVICPPSRQGGPMKIIDLNTNRGEKRKWSGDLVIPDVLGAYVRHLERHHGVAFAGEAGARLRANAADERKWLKRAGPEAVARHKTLRRQSARLRRFDGGGG